MKNTQKWMASVLAAALAVSPALPALAATEAVQSRASAGLSDTHGHWAQQSIVKWEANGVINGYADGTFQPDQGITRAEYVAILNRVFGFYAKSDEAFADVNASGWYSDELLAAREAGYYEGFPGNLAHADDLISRQDAVTLLSRIFSLTGNDDASIMFTDSAEIQEYARGAVKALTGILSGYEDGSFRPEGSITRAEVVTLMNKLVEGYYTEAGQFDAGSVTGNVVINQGGVVLRNATVSGNLYLTAGIADGEITLEGVKVTGKTFIAGGGVNSIIIKNSELSEVQVNRKEGQVRVLTEGTTQVGSIVVETPSRLELGSGTAVKEVKLSVPVALKADEGSTIGELQVGQGAAGMTISGTGTITNAVIRASQVKINGEEVAPGTVKVEGGKAVSSTGSTAGAGASTGSGSGSTGGGTTGGGTSSPIYNLADAQATSETRSLFDYLQSIRGTSNLFGHQHATTEGLSVTAKDGTQSDVQNAVGDLPGLFGWDTLSLEGYEKPGVGLDTKQQNRDNLIAVMKKAYQEGGVLTLSAHMPNFVTGGSFYDTKGKVVSHILPGGDKHGKYREFLDMVADFANNLKDDNGKLIPVIFRPFHEQNGGWFWWGAPYRTKEQYMEIYRFTVEYLRDVKGVHNFLYAFSPGSPFNNTEAAFLETYPGDDYVDILGFDSYYDGSTAGWYQTVVQDAKLISRLADAKGKIAAVTEFGYSGVKPAGTKDLEFFTKLMNALKSDPDAKRMAYMQTWANFNTDNIFVPYRNGLNGLGDHELLPNFQQYYNDAYTSFSDEVRAGNAYGKQVRTATEQPFLHIAGPTANQTVLATSASTVRARVLNQNVNKVVYLVGDDTTEHNMTLDAEGFYYQAQWTPGASLDETGTTLTVKSYARDGSVLSQAIQIYVSDVAENTDPLLVDTFDNYKGSNELLDSAYSPAGDLNTITLDAEHKGAGHYGLKFVYNVGGQGYTGQTKNMNNADWSNANKLKFWLAPDGSDQKLVIQVNASGTSFEAYPSLAGTTAGWVEIPFSEFAPAPWDTAQRGEVMTKENLKDIRAFSIYVNKKEGTASNSGTLYFDEIKAINDGTGGVPNGGTGPGSTPAQPGLLYGFETDTQGWAVDANQASATAASVTTDAASEGTHALQTTFTLSGTDFEVVKFESIDLSAVDTISAKVKLSAGTAQARLYIKAGSGWAWSDSGMFTVDSNGFTTIPLSLSGIASLSDVRAIGLKLESFTGTGQAAAYMDDIRLDGEGSGSTPTPQATVYGFESSVDGFTINTDNSNQYNTAWATGLAVSDAAYAAGTHSLKADFTLNGGQFQLRRMAVADLSAATTITAKFKVVPAEGSSLGSGVSVQLFTQSGSGWATWSAAAADPAAQTDGNGFVTVTLNIGQVADRNITQAIGLQVMTASGSTGTATIYVDEVTIK